MPLQLSGQPVTTNSSMLPHVAGAFVVAAGTALVTMISSADASVAHAATASPRIIDAKTPTFFILPPPEYERSQSCAGPTYTATMVLGKSLSAAPRFRSATASGF